jgi:cytidyltransferase-like protein
MLRKLSHIKPYHFTLYLGRFQPFHQAHLNNVTEALKISSHVILALGSCNRPVSNKNPWVAEQRKHIIQAAIPEAQLPFISMVDVDDCDSDALWVKHLLDVSYKKIADLAFHQQIALQDVNAAFIGVGKDSSTDSALDLIGQTIHTTAHPFNQINLVQWTQHIFANKLSTLMKINKVQHCKILF